jgi:putative FmdB family regulatory protein
MPTYEYRCTQCRHLFDIYQAVGEAAPNCPQCGAPTKKVFASVGLIFKGSGFHTTDYRKAEAGNGAEQKSSGAGAKESAPASDSAAKTSASSSSSSSSNTPSAPSTSPVEKS